MLKLKKTYAFIILFTQIATVQELNGTPMHPDAPLLFQWIKTILMGPFEYIFVYQQVWALHLTPFVYAMATLGIYAFYTWCIEDLGETWSNLFYTSHISWIILRYFTPEKYLEMDFSVLMSKLF